MPRPKGHPKTGGRIKGAINNRTVAKAAEKIEAISLTVERVKEEYGRIAFFDVRTLFNERGALKPIHEWPESAARVVAGIEVEEANEFRGRIHKVKVLNKLGALDSLGKHLGMFIDRSEITGKDGAAITVVISQADARL